jgi:uncharacterized protein YqiB (DUF1249 family)
MVDINDLKYEFEKGREFARSQHKTEVPRAPRSIYEMNFDRLNKVLGGNLVEYVTKSHANNTRRFRSEGYMDLVVETMGFEFKGGKVISMAHYYEQNGDLVSDPEMQVIVYVDGSIEAFSYQDQRVYQEVYVDENRYYTQLKKSMNDFLIIWTNNLIAQGHKEVDADDRQYDEH